MVLGALTGLIQAYGLVTTDLASLVRAPGGTFGNRNFMAHLVAIGLPLLLLLTLTAERRSRGFLLGAAGLALAVGALVLSRSRAAWLGAAAWRVFLAVEGLWVGRLWDERQLRRRVQLLLRRLRSRDCCSLSRCPTVSTGARTRPTSTPSPAWPTSRKGAGSAG